MAKLLAIQSADKRAKGIGWKAEPCPDPINCEGRPVRSSQGSRLHPEDPLASEIPPHVLLTADEQ